MGHEDELTTEELQEILNEEHQETQRNVSPSEQEEDERGPMPTSAIKDLLKKRLISGVWTVNSPQSHSVRVYDAGHGKSGVFHSAEWHDGDWSSDGIREAWLWFFIWVESF
ncbi:uncharacterized protein TNCV_5047961 [Trichonephila clavipes]|nr:uncharacterized protein TNCV_5047961 [Trichonephila clavipes]